MTLEGVLIVAGALFSIGLLGVLIKRSFVAVLMSLELMFIAVVVAALGFSRFTLPYTLAATTIDSSVSVREPLFALTGHILALFVIVIAAAETALGLALMFALHKSKGDVEITGASDLKG